MIDLAQFAFKLLANELRRNSLQIIDELGRLSFRIERQGQVNMIWFAAQLQQLALSLGSGIVKNFTQTVLTWLLRCKNGDIL